MRTTEDILKELQITKKLAETDLDLVKPNVRSGHEMAKRDAADRLPRLFREYVEVLFKGARALFPNGSPKNVEKYVQVARAEGGVGVVTVDGGELYKKIAWEIEPSIGQSRDFGVTQLQLLMALVKQISYDVSFKDPVPPVLNELRACTTFDDLVDYVRERIEAAMSDNLLVAFTQFKVADAACAAGFDGNILPVVVTGTSSQDRAALAHLFEASSSFDLDTAEAIDSKFVISTFKSVTSGTKSKAIAKPPRQAAPAKPITAPETDAKQTETTTNGEQQ